jgi:hypothetical protein
MHPKQSPMQITLLNTVTQIPFQSMHILRLKGTSCRLSGKLLKSTKFSTVFSQGVLNLHPKRNNNKRNLFSMSGKQSLKMYSLGLQQSLHLKLLYQLTTKVIIPLQNIYMMRKNSKNGRKWMNSIDLLTSFLKSSIKSDMFLFMTSSSIKDSTAVWTYIYAHESKRKSLT